MTNFEKAGLLRMRLHKLQTNGKNEDSPGVVQKLKRQIRKLESEA